MKKLLFALLLLVAKNGLAQNYYSVVNKFNAATQLNSDPTKPEDGTFQWNWLSTYGVGIQCQKDIFKNTVARYGVSYIKKGFRDMWQYGAIGTDVVESNTLKNEFEYISFDVLLKRYLSKLRLLRPYICVGIRTDYLFKTKLQSLSTTQSLFEPFKSYSNFNKLSGGWLLGIGAEINKLLFIELEVNKDLTKTINNERLIAKNVICSLNLGININELIRPKEGI